MPQPQTRADRAAARSEFKSEMLFKNFHLVFSADFPFPSIAPSCSVSSASNNFIVIVTNLFKCICMYVYVTQYFQRMKEVFFLKHRTHSVAVAPAHFWVTELHTSNFNLTLQVWLSPCVFLVQRLTETMPGDESF